MIKNIGRKKLKMILQPGKIEFPVEIRQKIEEHWKKVIGENSNLWNGEIVCVTDYFETETELIGLPDKYKCYNLFADSLLETQDGYYVIGELEENMSYPFCLQLPGGNVDLNDINDEKIDILHAIQREVLEELNVDIQDENQVIESNLKYLMHVLGKGNGYGVVAKTKLKMKAKQMKEHYEQYLKYLKENNLEVEFGKIHLLPKETVLEELRKIPNPQREYLQPLMEEESRGKLS